MSFSKQVPSFGDDFERLELTEYSTESVEHIRNFLSSRKLINVKNALNLRKERHDIRLERQLSKKDPALPFLKYRISNINKESKCDSQFVNNLHHYYGDGSNLGRGGGTRYAIDGLKKGSEKVLEGDKLLLKSLGSTSSNVSRKWINDAISCASKSPRRAFSCIDISFNIDQKQQDRRTMSWFHANTSIFDCDEKFVMPGWRDPQFACKFVTFAFANSVEFTSSRKFMLGKIRIANILFSTIYGTAYCVAADHDSNMKLRFFCSSFKGWHRFNTRPKPDRHTFRSKNVVIHMPEYEASQTQFRRARHIGFCGNVDYFLELDTAAIRKIENVSAQVVAMLPGHLSETTPAFFEVRFQGCEDAENCRAEITKRIEEIRTTGVAYITKIDERTKQCSRLFESAPLYKKHYNQGKSFIPVLAPMKQYKKSSLTTIFCEERDCQMMCGTSEYIKKEVETVEESPKSSPGITINSQKPNTSTHCTTLSDSSKKKYREYIDENDNVQSYLQPIPEDDKFFVRH